MPRLIGIVVGLVLFAALTMPVFAQTAPQGWRVESSAARWSATSSDQGGGKNVRIVYLPAVKTTAALEAWTQQESERQARALGQLKTQYELDRQQVSGRPVIASKTWGVIEPGRSNETFMTAWVYDTPRGRQMALTIAPYRTASENNAYRQALGVIGETWGGAIAYPPPAPPPAQARTQAPPGNGNAGQTAAGQSSTGKNCRREPVWGFRLSPFCQPSGICPDRVIKGYETVCD